MKGYAAAEIVGQHFSRFYTDEDRAADVPMRALQTAAREGRFETEGWRVRKDGSRFWASVVIDAIRDEDGSLIGFGKVTRDITERRQAQIALEEAREALFQSQKMEAVGQLTGGVAHDFNNLLQAISGSLEVVERRLAAGQIDVGQHVAAARTAVDRATALTQRLLAFARRQPLKPEYTNLNALVLGMRDLIQKSVGEAVQVEMRLADDLWPIWADANQIESALLNLAINARDAMPEGGRLAFETSNTHLDEVYVGIGTRPGARRLRHACGDRYGNRHAAGCARTRFRTLLHDETRWSGNRAGAESSFTASPGSRAGTSGSRVRLAGAPR